MSENYWGKNAVELHYADCEHTIFIPRGHTADHQHCYGCNPELAKVPLSGCCENCRVRRDQQHRIDSEEDRSALAPGITERDAF